MTLPFMIDLAGEVAVITGGGGVLCSMFARALATCGAKVAILDINLSAAQAVANDICNSGGQALAVEANCLEEKSLRAAYDAVKMAFGACTLLINGAGGNHPRGTTGDEMYDAKSTEGVKTFFDLDHEGIRFVFDLNFLGTLMTTQIFARDMADTGKGSIVNISSMNAFTPLTKIPAYSGAKAAVSNFTQWLSVYFAKSGVRVNAIAPGFFITNQNRGMLLNEDQTPTPRAEKILAATPMGRFGDEKELLGTLLYLVNASGASFVTGVVIPVDGGFSAYSGV